METHVLHLVPRDPATLPCAFFCQRITFDFLIVYVLTVKKIEGVTLGSATYFFIRLNPKWPRAAISDFYFLNNRPKI